MKQHHSSNEIYSHADFWQPNAKAVHWWRRWYYSPHPVQKSYLPCPQDGKSTCCSPAGQIQRTRHMGSFHVQRVFNFNRVSRGSPLTPCAAGTQWDTSISFAHVPSLIHGYVHMAERAVLNQKVINFIETCIQWWQCDDTIIWSTRATLHH